MANNITKGVESVSQPFVQTTQASKGESTPSLQIPTIDIGPYLRDANSPAAQAIVQEVRAACLSTGFFQITGHDVPKGLQQAVFSGAKEFFALPSETKKALDARKVRGFRGYDVLGSQSYEEGLMPDLKEGFITGEDLPDDDPRVAAGRFFMGSNVWPDPALVPIQSFRQPVEEYHAALTALTIRLLRIVEDSLPHGKGIFDDFVSNNPITPMRILHYPPTRESTDRRQYGASAHTDFGAITLLLQDESPGLEVLDRGTGSWVRVPPDPDAYVVNVGDMLSFWTGGKYVSSMHRVINRTPRDRYSIVFFFDGNADTELRALDGSEEDVDDPLTVERHMTRRLTESYGKRK